MLAACKLASPDRSSPTLGGRGGSCLATSRQSQEGLVARVAGLSLPTLPDREVGRPKQELPEVNLNQMPTNRLPRTEGLVVAADTKGLR